MPQPTRVDRDASAGPRWYRFSYYVPPKADRELGPHQLRDGDAALFLASVLDDLGYDYGGPIFNHPHPQQPPAELVQIDESQLGLRPEDLLVLTTRPPLDDEEDGLRSRVLRSYTTLEDKVFKHALRPHLARCSRLQLIVAERHAHQFPGVARRRNLMFRLNRRGARSGVGALSGSGSGAPITKCLPHGSTTWEKSQRGHATSAVYMIYERHAWPGGPGLLAAFGMSGTETLVWAYLLRTRFQHLVGTREFVMAEVVERDVPGQPLTLDFANHWDVRLLTEPDTETPQDR